MQVLAYSLDSFFGWLWRASWQASVVIALVALAQAVFHKQLGARWRHWLWLLVIVRLALPGSIECRFSVFNWLNSVSAAAPTIISSTTAVQPITPQVQAAPAGLLKTTSPRLTWWAALHWVWLAGATLLLANVITATWQLNCSIQRQRPVTDGAVLSLLEDCKEIMGVGTPLALVETAKVHSPAVLGFIRPRLLLPAGLTQSFSHAELRYIFLHELAHLKRLDIPLNWLVSLVLIVHWFNPLVWYAFSRLRADRELACDALALAHAQEAERQPYGQTILKLLEQFTRPAFAPGVLGILESKTHMQRRISMIAQFKRNSGWPILAGAVVAVLALFTLTDPRSGHASETTEPGQPNLEVPPQIIASSPKIGETEVNPSITEITVTFDRDMDKGFSWTGSGPDHPPVSAGQKPHWRDKRICVLPVNLRAAHFYRVGINSTSFHGFSSEEGLPARPSAIYFTTAGASEELKQKVNKPLVVALEPQNGATEVDPGVKELRVTFITEMGDGFSWCGDGPEFPTIPEGKRPFWTEDHKTCVLPVELEPGHEYQLGLNSPSNKNFQSAGGVPLEPVTYTFSTKQ